jgi:hypothetical protein
VATPSHLDVLRALAALSEGETLGQQDFQQRWDVQGGPEFRALLALLIDLQRAGWLKRYATYTRHFQYQITCWGREHLEREQDWQARVRRRTGAISSLTARTRPAPPAGHRGSGSRVHGGRPNAGGRASGHDTARRHTAGRAAHRGGATVIPSRRSSARSWQVSSLLSSSSCGLRLSVGQYPFSGNLTLGSVDSCASLPSYP